MLLRQCILECGALFNDIYLINAIFISLPFTAEWKEVKQSLFSQGSKITLDLEIIELNATYNRLMNDKDLKKQEKMMIIEQLALWSKLNQKGSQNSRSHERKKKKLKCKLKPEDICQDCGRKGHWSRIPECPKHKDKKGKKNGNLANYTVDDLHPRSKKDLGKREVGQILMVREDIRGKELLLDYGAIAYIFDE